MTNSRIGKTVIFNEYGTLYTGTIIAQNEVETGNFWFDVQKDDKTIVSVSIRNIEKITF
jgi:hypothetical protein